MLVVDEPRGLGLTHPGLVSRLLMSDRPSFSSANDFVLPHLKPENPFAGKFLTEDVRHDPKTPPF
jgi:hypothetical protein